MFSTPYPLPAPHAETGPSAWHGHPSATLAAATAASTPTRAPLGAEQLRPGFLVVLIVLRVLRLACEANNNPGPNRVPTDFFTLASGSSSDTGAGRSWSSSHDTSRGHHAPTDAQPLKQIAPKVRQSTLRERAAKHVATEVLELTAPRQPANPVDSTTRLPDCAPAGHRLRPGNVALDRATTTPPPAIPTKAGKGIRTLDIQLGKLTLYQLSYARELSSVYQWDSCF